MFSYIYYVNQKAGCKKMKNKTVEKLMRFLITLLGAGIGAALAALILPLLSRWYAMSSPYAPIALYAALCLVGAAVCFASSSAIIGRTMKLIAAANASGTRCPPSRSC